MKKIYIIQFRTDVSEEHEQKCFKEELSNYSDRLVFVSAVKGELLGAVPQDAAAVIMGGSGEFYLSEGHGEGDWLPEVHRFLQSALDNNIPFLGLCYGYQLFCTYLGARIVDDEEFRETGTLSVQLLPEAKSDPLFSTLPENFMAQFGHKDTIVDVPDTLIPLCKSERVACEAVRLRGKDAWGVLFHAELNRERIRERIEIFPNYTQDEKHMQMVLQSVGDSPEASSILGKFVEYSLQRAGA